MNTAQEIDVSQKRSDPDGRNGSRASVRVIRTNEELHIAQTVCTLLERAPAATCHQRKEPTV